MKLPKPVKKSEIEIYAAAYGSDTVHENVYWSYDENKNMLRITGTELPQGTGITVYIPLEEGYWVGQLNNDWGAYRGSGDDVCGAGSDRTLLAAQGA